MIYNISFINETGIVRRLINEIPEEYFNNVEIIGWLYQFYISEKKDSVNTSLKSKPIQKQDIPAATQLFTPDWIVKYMVDNSLGRYWIERNKNTQLTGKLEYLFEEPDQEEDVQSICNELRSRNIEVNDLKFFDSCMGSGHILVYAFDIFMEIYKELGYLEREIPELILINNLYGLDIDKRAYQLAYFALMMKARRYDRKLFKKNISLNIYPIIDSNISENTLNYLEKYNKDLFNEITYLNDIFSNASEFGSLLQVKNLNYDNTLDNIKTLITNAKGSILNYNIINEIENRIIPLINQAKVLSLKYEAVVTNPPYLNKYDKQLKDFSKKNYKDYSKDLFSMFIYRNFDFCKEDGYTAFMTPMVWMFIKNYEKLRKYIIDTKSIISLIELEYLALWEIEAYVPACTFVLSNQNYNSNYNGSYLKLTEYKGGLEVQNKKVLEALSHNDKNKYFINQNNFDEIPGSPIAYWIDDNLISCFNNTKLESLSSVKQGLATADNNRFLRFWYEVDFNKIGFSSKTCEESELTGKKWFPYNKGGSFRKWYGNQEYILNFENNGFELENFEKANVSNREFQFNESISWSRISSSKISFRYYPQGFLFDSASCSIFLNKSITKEYVLGLLNTNVSQEILNCIAPTLNYQAGDISLIPIIFNEKLEKNVIDLVNENIAISKRDWDDYEISWNFKSHPLLKYETNSIKMNFNMWEQYKRNELNLLTHNETKLNLLFSKIYNVKEDTEIKSQPSITIANLKEDIKSFISYAVGCMFGRYSLDCEGLNFAGGNFDLNKYKIFIPDDDNIIPVLDSEYFEDDIVGRFVEFVKTCFGEETLEENLDFIANTLSKSKKSSRERIRDYLLKNFFNDHKKTYKKRPIYWQFSSGKQNGFNCIVYIHRYEPSLVARIRTDYLHKTQKAIEQAISNCDNIINHSSSNTEINKATKDKNKLQKQLKETHEYDEVLAHIANQNIELDLDDGIKGNYNIFQNIELTQEGKKSKKVNLLKKI
ncbi:BREX-1 system adenine-specific DNA-methyltransferase PglX [Methanobrevibacter gottschalkii]|uniref:BREX-1 system adenine-specific DNA-methyltransferase PglX n=1 Tax=Methanobrevibacter gottschalkii TaxID=190974 RepID=UPI00350E3498